MGGGGWVAARTTKPCLGVRRSAGRRLSAQRGIRMVGSPRWDRSAPKYPGFIGASSSLRSGRGSRLCAGGAFPWSGAGRMGGCRTWVGSRGSAGPSEWARRWNVRRRRFRDKIQASCQCGLWVGGLRGPGTFRRGSFREPPARWRAIWSCLQRRRSPVRGKSSVDATSCDCPNRVWVLELDLRGGKTVWVRTTPQKLMAACCRRMGVSELTAIRADRSCDPALRFGTSLESQAMGASSG